MNIVSIKHFNSQARAQIAASMLSDAGIDCQVDGENLINVMPLTAGQVTLKVREEDEAAALEVLRDFEPDFTSAK